MRYPATGNTQTTVALVSCTGILGETLRRNLLSTADIAVVGEVAFDDIGRLSATIRRIRPDAVVWLTDDETHLVEHPELFAADRGCAVITVSDDGRRGSAWELRPSRTALDSPSWETLIDALRGASIRL